MADVAPKTLPADPSSGTGDSGRKRGRPAGSTNQAKSSNQVEQALAVLETGYQFMALGLTLIGAPVAASQLAAQLETVQTQNRGYLQADPKLAATISKIGAASGRAGFVITNFMFIAPVAMTAGQELVARRKANTPEPEAYEPQTETETAAP